MKIFGKKPETKHVCYSCNTAKRQLVPVLNFDTYSGPDTRWYCLSCLGSTVITAYLDEHGIRGPDILSPRGGRFLENLKYLDSKDLKAVIERLERKLKEERG